MVRVALSEETTETNQALGTSHVHGFCAGQYTVEDAVCDHAGKTRCSNSNCDCKMKHKLLHATRTAHVLLFSSQKSSVHRGEGGLQWIAVAPLLQKCAVFVIYRTIGNTPVVVFPKTCLSLRGTKAATAPQRCWNRSMCYVFAYSPAFKTVFLKD